MWLQPGGDSGALVPDTQAERLAVLEELQQIPLKLRAQQQQPLIFACGFPASFASFEWSCFPP